MEKKMEPPKRIYLQQSEDPEEEGFVSGEEVTWCEDRQGPHDVKYVRADLHEKLTELIDEIELIVWDDRGMAVDREDRVIRLLNEHRKISERKS